MLALLQNNQNKIFVVILIIIIWYTIHTRCTSSMYANLLSGFWKADADFLDEAELNSFVLYFAPSNWKGIRACYILAEKNGELVINEPCSVKVCEKWEMSNWSTSLKPKTYDLLFSDLETDDFPKKQNMVFNPNSGKIVISKADTIYGVFYKDSYLTDTICKDKILELVEECSETDDDS